MGFGVVGSEQCAGRGRTVSHKQSGLAAMETVVPCGREQGFAPSGKAGIRVPSKLVSMLRFTEL